MLNIKKAFKQVMYKNNISKRFAIYPYKKYVTFRRGKLPSFEHSYVSVGWYMPNIKAFRPVVYEKIFLILPQISPIWPISGSLNGTVP